jgi:hypothetical protein
MNITQVTAAFSALETFKRQKCPLLTVHSARLQVRIQGRSGR